MKTNIKTYCLIHRTTVKELFYKAYKDTRKRKGGAFILRDIEIYKHYRAIPSYVSEFLEQAPSYARFNPYYASA